MAVFALAIKGASIGVIDHEISICVIGYGTRDAPSVTVHLRKPDGSTRTYSTSVLPAYRGGLDVAVVTIPKEDINLSGNYTIYADTTVDGTTYTSNTLAVSVPPKIRTLMFTLKDPYGNPMKESYGSIVLAHKKTGSMAIYVTDVNGQVSVPEFATNTDWLMEVHFRNPNNPKEFDLKLYDPVDFRVLPAEFKASGWFTEKYFKITIEISREKFLDFLAMKSPQLARHTWLVDRYPVLSAYIVANEILGGLPYLLIQGASYDAEKGILTVIFRGLGLVGWVQLALLIIAFTGVVLTGIWAIKHEEASKEWAEAEQTKNRLEAEQQFSDLVKYVAELRATGALTKEDVSLLLGAATEYSSKWQPPALGLPSWAWAIIAVIIVIVIAYVIVKVVPAFTKRRR